MEKLLGRKRASLLDQGNTDLSKALDIVVEKYISHPRVKKNEKNSLKRQFNPFSIPKVSNNNVSKLLKYIICQ